MDAFILNQENINWRSSQLCFKHIYCEKSDNLLSGKEMWQAFKEWTPDVNFYVELEITIDYDVIAATSKYDRTVVTKDIYENRMGAIVKAAFKQKVFLTAFYLYLPCVEEFEELDSEQQDFFCKQFAENNMIDLFNISNMFTFWTLQEQGIITKNELVQLTNRDMVIYLINRCLQNGYTKEVALEWSHEYLLDEKFEAWFTLLDIMEGDYVAYSNMPTAQRENMLEYVELIKEEDLLRATELMKKYPEIQKAIKAIKRKKLGVKLGYKDVLIAQICFKKYDLEKWCEYKEHFDSIIKDKLKEDLEKLFIEKYHRIPKILDKIVTFCDIRQVKAQDFIKVFDYKLLSKLLKYYHTFTALYFMVNKLEPALIGLHETVIQCLLNQEKNTKETLEWLKKHKKTNVDFLIKVINCNIITNENMPLRAVKRLIDIQEAKILMHKIEEKYKKTGFEFKNYKSLLEDCTVEYEGMRAFMLKDERIAILGELTCCCQKLNGAGESAMMYGLLAPNGGFWACEKVNGDIFAQGEVWLGELPDVGRTFVFDNIELANDRSIKAVENVLRAWCKKSHYQNIIMGCGYNELIDEKYIWVGSDIEQPYCEYVPRPYTDTYHCVWLKKSGTIVF